MSANSHSGWVSGIFFTMKVLLSRCAGEGGWISTNQSLSTNQCLELLEAPSRDQQLFCLQAYGVLVPLSSSSLCLFVPLVPLCSASLCLCGHWLRIPQRCTKQARSITCQVAPKLGAARPLPMPDCLAVTFMPVVFRHMVRAAYLWA